MGDDGLQNVYGAMAMLVWRGKVSTKLDEGKMGQFLIVYYFTENEYWQ